MAAIAEMGPKHASLRRVWPTGRDVWPVAVLLGVVALVATPLIFLVLGSFSTASIPGEFTLETMGLANYRQVWLDRDTYRVFGDTMIYVGGATLIGITVATILAWLVERTNVPGKVWIYAGVPMTLAIPGMLQGIAWVLLLSPRIGNNPPVGFDQLHIRLCERVRFFSEIHGEPRLILPQPEFCKDMPKLGIFGLNPNRTINLCCRVIVTTGPELRFNILFQGSDCRQCRLIE